MSSAEMRSRAVLPVIAVLAVLVVVGSACGTDSSARQTSDEGATLPGVAGEWILAQASDDTGVWELPDRELTVTIANGQLRGNGSCNSFSGDFMANDDGVLDPLLLAMTEMACIEPELMAFEQQYVGALRASNTWAVGPEGLTLAGPDAQFVYRQR